METNSQKPLNELLQREMTRKQFLATLGLGLASVFGFSGIIRLLTGKSLDRQFDNSNVYGGGPYSHRR